MNQPVYKIRLSLGDTVMVRSGKHKGKTGKVTAIHYRDNKVTVEGINVVKRHIKPNRVNPKGSEVSLTKPLWVSQVGIVEPTSKRPSRISYKLGSDGNKTRVFSRTKKAIKETKS